MGYIWRAKKKEGFSLKKELSDKEKRFCKYIADSLTPREAAARCGYLFPEKSGQKLLSKRDIKEYISKIETKKANISEVENGLRRIIFGQITDSIKLTKLEELSPVDIETLDLFSVSELKFNKNGTVDLKFFDKIKALEKLYEISEKSSSCAESGFFEALRKSSEDIWEVGS